MILTSEYTKLQKIVFISLEVRIVTAQFIAEYFVVVQIKQ